MLRASARPWPGRSSVVAVRSSGDDVQIAGSGCGHIAPRVHDRGRKGAAVFAAGWTPYARRASTYAEQEAHSAIDREQAEKDEARRYRNEQSEADRPFRGEQANANRAAAKEKADADREMREMIAHDAEQQRRDAGIGHRNGVLARMVDWRVTDFASSSILRFENRNISRKQLSDVHKPLN